MNECREVDGVLCVNRGRLYIVSPKLIVGRSIDWGALNISNVSIEYLCIFYNYNNSIRI